MLQKLISVFKSIILSLILVFIFVILLYAIIYGLGNEKIEKIYNYLENSANGQANYIKPILKDKILINNPTQGTKYALLKINDIEVELPIYYGASYTTLKSGIVHDEKSFFPGEGGSIILAGHNFKEALADLPEVEIGSEIEVNTTYGSFKYSIYETKIVKETQKEEIPIQQEKEILMLYTCWPINNVRHASKRYVVYAKLVEE